MNETEGPSRTRVRLKRCHNRVDDKFLLPIARIQNAHAEPLQYLNESLVQRPHFPLNDQVLYTFACSHLPVDKEVDGEIVITESHLIFLANNLWVEPICLEIGIITDIWLRRYQHQDTGLEFYLESNTSVLFIFMEASDRAILVDFFADKVVQW